ncbi:pilus assembly FimT family protein [Halolactibacillus halophilus]
MRTNEAGFTLVEVIATVNTLCIILVIAVPAIT